MSDLAGFVRLTEGTRAVPRDWIIIGLAGLLASLRLAIASAAHAFSVPPGRLASCSSPASVCSTSRPTSSQGRRPWRRE